MGFAARITKRTAVIASVSALALGGGIAFAFWSVGATGSGSATAGTSSDVTFAAGTSGTLYPNGQAVNVIATATNPNQFAVDFTVSDTSVVSVDTTHASLGCTTTGVTFAGKVVHLAAAADSNTPSVASVTVGTLTMGANAKNECQGATFSVAIAGTGASV